SSPPPGPSTRQPPASDASRRPAACSRSFWTHRTELLARQTEASFGDVLVDQSQPARTATAAQHRLPRAGDGGPLPRAPPRGAGPGGRGRPTVRPPSRAGARSPEGRPPAAPLPPLSAPN